MDPELLRGGAAWSQLSAAMKQTPLPRSREGTSRGDAVAAVRKRPNLLAGERLARTPSQKRSRRKREKLLRAALELFEQRGYERTSIEMVAKRAQIATGGFYQYFRSKRQILLVLMNDLLRKLEQIDMQPATNEVRSAISSLLRAGLTADLAYSGAYRAWKEATVSDRELAALDGAIREWTTSRLALVFGLLQRLPNARREVNIGLFAPVMDRLFWSLLGTPLQGEPRMVEILSHIISCSLFVD
jgi:AcrR family transcriptional regulator